MSSEINNGQPTDYINPLPNSEVRLAYYVYTWDNDNMQRQRAAWSSIGTYYLSNNGDVIYGSNQNQLIKSAGSAGVNIVDNTLGLIANVKASNSNNTTDVSPIIIYADGTYLAGLDNNTIRYHFDNLHTTLDTIDLHFIKSKDNFDDYKIVYSDLFGKSLSSENIQDGDKKWVSYTTPKKGDIIENTFIPLVGESGGINKVTNRGFIYNGLEYHRQYDPNITWRNFVNYVGNWSYGGSSFNVVMKDGGKMTINSASATNIITAVTDRDVLRLGDFKQELENIYSSIANVNTNNNDVINGDSSDYQKSYTSAVQYITSAQNQINILLGNEAYNDKQEYYPHVSQVAISKDIFLSISNALAIYSNVSDIKEVWVSNISAISVEKLPWNSTFIDINPNSTATGFVIANDRTKTWQYTQFPTIDETWLKIAKWTATNDTYKHYLLNQYPITITTASATIPNDVVWYSSSTGYASMTSDNVNLWTKSNNGDIIPTSMSYYIDNSNNYNLVNSANKYRFLGMTTTQENYSNSEGSNVISITGFNKILLEDLYENPNNYQIPTTTWYWKDSGKTQSSSNASDVPVNKGISCSLSITSALKSNTNVLVAGVGATDIDKGAQIGYNGVFYIPLPSYTDMNTDEDGKYEDTHWMLTTYTPNINKGASNTGLWNSGKILYKYSKMSNLITTGVFGGFTPYHTANKIVANLVNIPQVSYSSDDYKINGKTVVTAGQNKTAKINKLISNIAYIVPANGVNNKDTTTENGWYKTFTNQITSNSDKCTIITLNSYEAAIIKDFKIDSGTSTLANNPIGNAMYLDLFGYKDEEWNNLSFDVNRKYIFTFNCHVQATNLQLTSEQINYGTPSLLLLGHFRQRYAKSTLQLGNFGSQAYPGETMLIPLLNKPLENAVNNIYNIEGTYTLSWDTTGTNDQKATPQAYSFYIQDQYNDVNISTDNTTMSAIYETVYKNSYNENHKIQGTGGDMINGKPSPTIGIPNTTLSTGGNVVTYPTNIEADGNRVKWMNVLDRIYAFILVGPNVNPNLSYQFVNINTYQEENRQILAPDDIALFAGMNNVITSGTSTENDTNVLTITSSVRVIPNTGKTTTTTTTISKYKVGNENNVPKTTTIEIELNKPTTNKKTTTTTTITTTSEIRNTIEGDKNGTETSTSEDNKTTTTTTTNVNPSTNKTTITKEVKTVESSESNIEAGDVNKETTVTTSVDAGKTTTTVKTVETRDTIEGDKNGTETSTSEDNKTTTTTTTNVNPSTNKTTITKEVKTVESSESNIEAGDVNKETTTVIELNKPTTNKKTTTTTTTTITSETRDTIKGDENKDTTETYTKDAEGKNVATPRTVNISSLDEPAPWLGIDSGILGICEPMFSMTIQRY